MMACLCPCIGSYDIKKHRYQFKVSFRIHVKEIRFKRNDYFLKNSHYNFYSKGAFRKKIKGTVEVEDINALAKLPVDGMMKIYGTLSQSMQGKYINRYKPLIKRIMVRQITTVSRYDEIYKTIGHIELPLHELVKIKEPKEFLFPLIDEEDGVDAMVRIVVERKLKNDPYAGSLLYRTGKYVGHELYNMLFPQEIPDVPTRFEHNKHYFDILRQRDNSEFKEQILEDEEQRILRREYEQKKALEAKRLAAGLPLNTETEGNLTPNSNNSPSNNRKSNKMTRTTTEEELQKLQFSEDDFDENPTPIRSARSPSNKNIPNNNVPVENNNTTITSNNNTNATTSNNTTNNVNNVNASNAMVRKHSNNSNVSNASNNPYVPYYMLESSHTSSHNSSNNNLMSDTGNPTSTTTNNNNNSNSNAYNESRTASSDSHDRLPVRKVNKRPSGVRAAQQQQQLLLQQQQQQQAQKNNNNIYGIASQSYGSSASLSPQHTPNGGSKSFNYDDVYGAESNDDRFNSAYPSNTASNNINNVNNNNNVTGNSPNTRSRFAEAYQQQYEATTQDADNLASTTGTNSGYYGTNPYRAATANIYTGRPSVYNSNSNANPPVNSHNNNSMYAQHSEQVNSSSGSVSGGFTAPRSSVSAYNMTSPPIPGGSVVSSSTGATPRRKGRIAESGITPTPSPSLNTHGSSAYQNPSVVTPPPSRMYANGEYNNNNNSSNYGNNAGEEYVRSGASVGSYNRRMSSGYFESPRSYGNNANNSYYESNPASASSSNPIEARIVKRLSQQGQSFYGQQYISALEKNASTTPTNSNNSSYYAQPNYQSNQGFNAYEDESIHSYPSQQLSVQHSQQQPVVRKKVRRIAESSSPPPSSYPTTFTSPPAAPATSYSNNTSSRPVSGTYNAYAQSNNSANYNDSYNNNSYNNNSNMGNGYDTHPHSNGAYPKQYTISTHYSTVDEDNTPSYAQHALYQPYSPLGASFDSEATSPSLANPYKGRSGNTNNNPTWQNLPLQTLGQRYNSVGGNAINAGQTTNNAVQSPSYPAASNSSLASGSQDQSSRYFAPAGYYQDR